jgi:hypothetical protein
MNPIAVALDAHQTRVASTLQDPLGLLADVRATLPALETLYLDELMNTSDAVEGVRACLDKRAPEWSDR